MMPQTVPIYNRPPGVPSPITHPFPMPAGQPIFSPVPFAYPPVTWSPIHHPYPPPTGPTSQQQPAYNLHAAADDNEHNDFVGVVPLQPSMQLPLPVYFDGNGMVGPAAGHIVPTNEDRQAFQHHGSWLPHRLQHSRWTSNKYDTKHEKFRKYLEETGILSSFTNSLTEMYQDPLRPSNPFKLIGEKLNDTRPETIELSNLRLWCVQYQIKIEQLQTELKHVIERLKKHEPYDTDDSFSNSSSLVNTEVNTFESLEESNQEHTLKQREENGNCSSFINNNQ